MSRRHTCDTSVLVPALLPWHESHATARAAVAARVRAVPAHVLLECYSVLTRLPAPHRLAPAPAAELLRSLDWEVLELAESAYADLLQTLARSGIAGGAAYDGVVAATAASAGCTLLTSDVRARRTYDAVGVKVETV